MKRLGQKVGRVTVANYKDIDLQPYGFEKGDRFFHANLPITAKGLSFKEVKGKNGDIIDIRDVKVEGHAATFNNLDRDGEKFAPGAFAEDLANFMKNPVMLKDHWNSCDRQVGSFDEVREDNKGLFVRGTLSNSPLVSHIRFLVAEGHLKTFSVAGMFHFDESRVTIMRAFLWEISLIPIPANPRAIFEAITSNPVFAKGAMDGDEENPTAGSRSSREVAPRAASRGGLSLAGIRVR